MNPVPDVPITDDTISQLEKVSNGLVPNSSIRGQKGEQKKKERINGWKREKEKKRKKKKKRGSVDSVGK